MNYPKEWPRCACGEPVLDGHVTCGNVTCDEGETRRRKDAHGFQFSVCQFFDTGESEYVRRFVSAEEAVKAACHYITSVAARFGFVERVIITDGGDCMVFEWKKGLGITWPEQLT